MRMRRAMYKKIILNLFFIGFLIKGSILGDGTWFELEVIPDLSGELKLSDCSTTNHVMDIVKSGYYPSVKYFAVSCEEFEYFAIVYFTQGGYLPNIIPYLYLRMGSLCV